MALFVSKLQINKCSSQPVLICICIQYLHNYVCIDNEGNTYLFLSNGEYRHVKRCDEN